MKNLDLKKLIIAEDGRNLFLLVPLIEKGSYKNIGYNWFDLKRNYFNSCCTWETKEGAVESYTDEYTKIYNVDENLNKI